MQNISILVADDENELVALAEASNLTLVASSPYATLTTFFTHAKLDVGNIEDSQTGWVGFAHRDVLRRAR